MLFVPVAPGESVPADAVEAARDLECDLIVMEIAGDRPITLRAAMRLWGSLFWRDGLQLWRDEGCGRCCLIDGARSIEHLWLQSGRVVAHAGAPWREGNDRDLGFARAGAPLRRLVREG